MKQADVKTQINTQLAKSKPCAEKGWRRPQFGHLPTGLGDDHLVGDGVELLPKFEVLQDESHCVTLTVFTFYVTGMMKSTFKR